MGVGFAIKGLKIGEDTGDGRQITCERCGHSWISEATYGNPGTALKHRPFCAPCRERRAREHSAKMFPASG